MGRAARWLAGLFGWKKPDAGSELKPAKEKKWRFGKSYREKKGKAEPPVKTEEEERKGSYREVARPYGREEMAAAVDGDEQSKHAIAVAAATAAVAEAAVAAAQAAAAVVRLTSSSRSVRGGGGGVRREEWAAVMIQSVFRGYLARRALRALRGLVKLQALVRGNIVRKQAAETLRCMHALVRVQARARACRALHSERDRTNRPSRSSQVPPKPEKHDQTSRTNGPKSSRSTSLKRNSSKSTGQPGADHGRSKSAGWNWLDQWMEEKYSDSRGLSSRTGGLTTTDDEKSTKILEIDPGKPQKPTPNRKNSNQQLATPESPSKDSTTAQLSVPSPSSVDMEESLYSPYPFPLEEESPYFSTTSRPGRSTRGSFTPAKSECSRSFFGGYTDYPNYMTNTESSRAKIRSQSAPKQRPELDKLGSVKKYSALHARFANKGYPGSGRLDRLGMPVGY